MEKTIFPKLKKERNHYENDITFSHLSRKEEEIMDLLWDAKDALSRSEILEEAAKRTQSWKPNSIHILVNSLLDKGAVEVAGFYLNSRKLGRTFSPSLTREDYAIMQVEIAAIQAREEKVAVPSRMAAAIVAGATSVEALDEMVKVIEAKKKEIQGRKK